MAPTVLDKIMQVIKDQNTPGQRWSKDQMFLLCIKMYNFFPKMS